MSDAGSYGLLYALSGITLVLSFIVACGLYLLFSYGLYRMAEKAGVENSWFAFIPIVQYYTMGKVIREVKIGSYVIPHLEWVLVLAPFAYVLLSLIPIINFIAGIIYVVFYIIVTYSLFKKYSHNAVLMTILGFLVPFLYPIFVFALRNSEPIKPA